MKWIKRIVVVGVLLIVVAAAAVYLSLNAIVRSVVQRQATASLGVPTTLGSARLSLAGGKVQLNDLLVGSPPKFTAPDTFTLGGIAVTVNYGQLTGTPIHIQQITIDRPVLVIEQVSGALNLKALMDQMPQTPQTSGGQPTQPIKLVIDEMDLNSAEVTFMPGIPGLAETIQVSVPSMTLKNIGNSDGSQNGAAIKEVVLQVATALAAKGADGAKLPPEVKMLLSGQLNGLSQQLGGEFNKQFQGLAGSLGKQVQGKVGNLINSGGQSAIQQLLGGSDKNKQK
ncbi:MAG: hypothetical protein ABSB33_06015 [Tepidisphaeraceae bacterium]|jgi:hypothetical protein